MVRKIFLGILFFALALNLYLDYRVYEQGLGRGAESLMVDQLIMAANVIDVGLLLVLMAFFLFEYDTNRRTQMSLRKAMEHLNAVNDSLKAAEAESSVFFKKTIHDLKNPLGSIRGFAELIGDDSEDPRTIAQMSQTIQRISDGTLALVNSLLLPGRKTIAIRKFQDVDLGECVEETCRFLQPMAAAKQQRIVFEPPNQRVAVQADALKMRDVFFNLIGNAVKFSPVGASTRVYFGGVENLLTVTIEDEGPGLTADDLNKLYLPGQKLSARATGGEASSGFGLYSVKETVEMHGGRLEAFNNGSGRGASFVVRLSI